MVTTPLPATIYPIFRIQRARAKGDLKKMETSIREIIGEILDMIKTEEEG